MFGTRQPRTTVVTDRAQLEAALGTSDRIVVEGPPDLLNFALGYVERGAADRPDTAFAAQLDIPPSEVTSEGRSQTSTPVLGVPRRKTIVLIAAAGGVGLTIVLCGALLSSVGSPLPFSAARSLVANDPQWLAFGSGDGSKETSKVAGVDDQAGDLAASGPSNWRDPDEAPSPVPSVPPPPPPPPEHALQSDPSRNDTAPSPRSEPSRHHARSKATPPETKAASDSTNPLQALLQTAAWPIVAIVAILCLFVVVLIALRTNRDVDLSWKVTEKFEGRVVITKTKTPRARVRAA